MAAVVSLVGLRIVGPSSSPGVVLLCVLSRPPSFPQAHTRTLHGPVQSLRANKKERVVGTVAKGWQLTGGGCRLMAVGG